MSDETPQNDNPEEMLQLLRQTSKNPLDLLDKLTPVETIKEMRGLYRFLKFHLALIFKSEVESDFKFDKNILPIIKEMSKIASDIDVMELHRGFVNKKTEDPTEKIIQFLGNAISESDKIIILNNINSKIQEAEFEDIDHD